MKRKLVKQGSSTMMISLPSKWVKNNNLEKGSEVDIEEKENTLLISGKSRKEGKKEIIIHITDENRHDIRNILTHLYRNAFEKIMIKNIDQGISNELIRIVDLLLGFEIVDKTNDFCIIENITEPADEKYDVMIRRIFLIIKETHRTISEDMEKGKLERFEEIEEQRRQQDKHVLFCRRVLMKEQKNSMLEWELLTFLTHIEHKYYYLYKYSMNKYVPDNQTNQLMKRLGQYLEMFYDAYFQKDIQKIHKINKSKDEFYFQKCYLTIEKSQGKKSVIISSIAEIYRLIQIGTSPMLGKIIEKDMMH